MTIEETKIKGLYIINPKVFNDERGYFSDIFNKTVLKKHNLEFSVDQISHSFNIRKGTLRGMHFQKAPYEQAKIVHCLRGAIYDVAIDIRPDSPTYNQWVGVELTEENKRSLFIPAGFAHGFQTLADNSLMQYIISGIYSPESSSGVHWNDPVFNINWPIIQPIINDRDNNWPFIKK